MDMTPADVAAVTRNNNCGNYGGYGWGDGCGMGGGWFAWILIFALLGGGGFGGWGNGRNGCVTEADLCNANSFSELKGQIGRMNDQQAAIARQNDNAICQIGYQNLQNTNLLERQISDCCCTTQRAVDSVKFDMANYAAASNANTTAVGQKILDKLCAMENDSLRSRVQQLELDRAFCGVPRFLPGTVYGTTHCTPFFGFGNNCGCGCNV